MIRKINTSRRKSKQIISRSEPWGASRSRRKDDGDKRISWLKKIADVLTPIRTIIGTLLIAGLSLLLIYTIYIEVRVNSIEIRSFTVPPDFPKDGRTSEVITNKLADKVKNVSHRARSSAARPEFKVPNSDSVPADITVPSTNITLRSLISQLRPKSPVVEGEITQTGKFINVTIRIHNSPGRDDVQYESYTTAEENLDLLLDKAGEYIVRITSPYSYASYLYEMGRFIEALEVAKYCAYSPPESDDAWGYILWGLILYDQKHYDEAIEKNRIATEKDPRAYDAYINWGLALMAKKDNGQAREKFNRARELNPKGALAYNNLGILMMNDSDYAGAIQAFNYAINIDPSNTKSFENLGRVYLKDDKYKEATDVYEKAIALNYEKADEIYLRWGSALREVGNYFAAVEKYRFLIARDANLGRCNAKAHNSAGYALQEKAKIEKKTSFADYAEAISEYKKSIECDDQSVLAYDNWQDILENTGGDKNSRNLKDFKTAVLRFENSVKVSPRNFRSYSALARFLITLKRFKEAVTYHDKGVINTLDVCSYNYDFATLLESKGQFDLAAAMYDKVVSIKPQCPQYDDLSRNSRVSVIKKLVQKEGKYYNMRYIRF